MYLTYLTIIHNYLDFFYRKTSLTTMATILVFLIVLPYVILCNSTTTALTPCTFNNITNCSIENGLANCSSDQLPPVVESLPICITTFHFTATAPTAIGGDHELELSLSNLSRLINLSELYIEPTDRVVYAKIILSCFGNTTLKHLQRLQVIAIKMKCHLHCQHVNIVHDFLPFRLLNLEVLDFSRSYALGISYFNNLNGYPVKHLVLKYCQTLKPLADNSYTGVLNITELLCPLGNTLRSADLSFNDIIAVVMKIEDILCMKMLHTLDLRFNLIQSIGSVDELGKLPGMGYFYFYSIEYLIVGDQWSSIGKNSTISGMIKTYMNQGSSIKLTINCYNKKQY